MAWMLLALGESLLVAVVIAVIIAQRAKLIAKTKQYWNQEREISRLEIEGQQAAVNVGNYMRSVGFLTDKIVEMSNKPPVVIDPPDVAKIVHEVGESIGTAIYGRQQEIAKDLQDQVRQTSMVEEKIAPNEWFPDVEFDEQMGPMPTHGGWVNPQTNGNTAPGTDQTPVHGIVNGKLVRLDGQAAFAPGTTAPMPQGGVE